MLERLVGLETEYALRFSPAGGGARPTREEIYRALAREIQSQVRTRPASGLGAEKFFTENGGAFNREGEDLIEGSTPECRGPAQVLLYQRAQDELLTRALGGARARLAARGYPGDLGLLKNCRDAQGHVYGAQENYEVTLASGPRLVAYRVGLALVLPFALPAIALSWLAIVLVFALALALIPLALLVLAVPSLRRGWERLERNERLKRLLGQILLEVLTLPWWPVLTLLAALLRITAFPEVRQSILAFLLSRPLLSGTGTLGEDARFRLSEKGLSVNRVFPLAPRRGGIALFDVGNLLKALLEGGLYLQPRRVLHLFARRQRMQLGLSDSNAAQLAEYLKVAITTLVIDMAEAGYLDDAPQLRDPVDALHRFIGDPTLRATAPLADGRVVSALELQRFYLERAGRYLGDAPATPLAAGEILRLWREALAALEGSPEKLVGRLDWVTKKYLLDTAGREASPAARKKIDLKYHELGSGYLERLAAAGQAPALVSAAEIEVAMRQPPRDTPAFARGRLVRWLADSEVPAAVSWRFIRAGRWLSGEVIRLADFRVAELAGGDLPVESLREAELPEGPEEEPDYPSLVRVALANFKGRRVFVEVIPPGIEANVRRHVLPSEDREAPLVAVIDLTYRGTARDAVAVTPSHLCAREIDQRARFALTDVLTVRPRFSHLEVRLEGGRIARVPTGSREEVLLELLTRIAMRR